MNCDADWIDYFVDRKFELFPLNHTLASSVSQKSLSSHLCVFKILKNLSFSGAFFFSFLFSFTNTMLHVRSTSLLVPGRNKFVSCDIVLQEIFKESC